MSNRRKLLDKVLRGQADANISFAEMCRLLASLGFAERIRGDHHIFTIDDVEEIVNIQPAGDLCKAYQVKQIRAIIVRYRLGGSDD